MFIFPLIYLGNVEEKDRSTQNKKAKDKDVKQNKTRGKNEGKLLKKNNKVVELPRSVLNNDCQRTGTYNKVHDDNLHPNREHNNAPELSSEIETMNLHTSEKIGKIL